ncbi:MAG: DUF4843 domain-containing protein [Odoribacteraceae bacterium]|jgi:hypothetical protein|nr:DUF4843 domain-containing protein [Odoribacteraceae bacterium]
MNRITTSLLILLLAACEPISFEWGETDYARVVGPASWTLGTDSLLYTFSTKPADLAEFVVEAEVLLVGKLSDRDRAVIISIDPERTTAIKGTHYDIPESVVIPAGEAVAALPIALRRTADLQAAPVTLRLEIDDAGDLGPGPNEWRSLSITWNDMISRPLNWDVLLEFFGDYSNVKFRFIISTLGIAEFTYGQTNGMDWGVMNNYHLVLVEALAAYNAAHPSEPLVDENLHPITF